MFDEKSLIEELQFKAVRSSGSGGQHVNKVASKVELQFDISNSTVLNENQIERLIKVLENRLTKNRILLLQCDESRSQHRNKEIIITRFIELIKGALIVPKKRKKTKIPKAVVEKRLKNKTHQSEKKVNRRKPDVD